MSPKPSTIEPVVRAPTAVRVLKALAVDKIKPSSSGKVTERGAVSDAMARVVVNPSPVVPPSKVIAFSPEMVPPTVTMSSSASPTMTSPRSCDSPVPATVSSPKTGVLDEVRIVPDSSGKVMILSDVGFMTDSVSVW